MQSALQDFVVLRASSLCRGKRPSNLRQSIYNIKDLKCVVVVCRPSSVIRRPVWSVPIEFPRMCISVNPCNCTYAFPRMFISTFYACIQQYDTYFTLALSSSVHPYLLSSHVSSLLHRSIFICTLHQFSTDYQIWSTIVPLQQEACRGLKSLC